MSYNRSRRAAIFLAALALLPYSPLASAQAGWIPDRPIEIVIPSGPGSGTDLIGRNIQNILSSQKLVPSAILAVNKAGGGGALGLNYLNQFQGNGHYLYITSPTLLTSFITGATSVNHTQVTPLAQLFNEYVVITVGRNSKIRDGRALMDLLLKDPASISIGLATALGNANHIAIAGAYKAAGGDPKRLKVVVFKSGGEGITAAMGGHIDVNVIGAIAAIPHLQDNKLRAIAITSPKRQPGLLAGVPTLMEQGVNATSGQWRGLVGPRGMTEAQIAYWDGILAKLVATPEWAQVLETNMWEPTFLRSRDSRKFLESEFQELKSILASLGLAR
jgi:putative tricarboxylic transport membrane protein